MTSETRADTSERQRCKATRKDGQPCKGWAQADGLCIGHSPRYKDARRKGGYHSSKKHRADKLLPIRLRPILVLIERALLETYQGKLPERRATAMSTLANAIVKLYEAGVLEDRLQVLEDRILKGGSNGHKGQNSEIGAI